MVHAAFVPNGAAKAIDERMAEPRMNLLKMAIVLDVDLDGSDVFGMLCRDRGV